MTMLKLDLDGKDSFNTFLERVWIIKGFGLCPTDCAVYETKNGFHVYIQTDIYISAIETLFIQCCLSSDYRKELFGFLRYKRGYIDPEDYNVLFKIKETMVLPQVQPKKGEETFNKDLTDYLKNKLESGFRRSYNEISWVKIR